MRKRISRHSMPHSAPRMRDPREHTIAESLLSQHNGVVMTCETVMSKIVELAGHAPGTHLAGHR